MPFLIIRSKIFENNNYINITAKRSHGIDNLIENIEEFEFSKLNTVNKSFEKISLENEDFSIKRKNDRWEITGQLAERITNLNGNEYDVFNEISYRFENSEIPAELEEMGINKGDLIKLNNSEFEYEK